MLCRCDWNRLAKLHLSLDIVHTMILYQWDIVRDSGEGGMDVLLQHVGLAAFCRGAVSGGGACFPVGVLHLLYLIVNQHDEGAYDNEEAE